MTLGLALLGALPGAAQTEDGPDPDRAIVRSMAGIYAIHETVRDYLLAAARQMPEEHYAFAPTPEVRSFGQILGHVANTGYLLCAPVLGETPPLRGDAEALESKAEILVAIEASFRFCDQAFAVEPTRATASLPVFGQDHTGISLLALYVGHNFEHYGNIVSYLRLKGMVPPSSRAAATEDRRLDPKVPETSDAIQCRLGVDDRGEVR